jgi:hypothetical protein
MTNNNPFLVYSRQMLCLLLPAEMTWFKLIGTTDNLEEASTNYLFLPSP